MKIAAFLRTAALVTSVALIPATTATMAQVDGRASPEFAKLFAVFQRVKASYVEPVEDEVLIRGAIDGMLAALDPHSAYLDGGDLQRLETMIDGQYSGLGLSVVMEDGAVKVVSPFRGSPAETAGIKAGDFITHIDGKLIVDTKLDDAVAQMRGPKGTSIRLTIFRRGREEPLEVDVTRGVIELEPVTSELLSGNIAVISVNEFSANVGADVFAEWQALKKKAPGGRISGLVLDLRNNPGGSLDESVALSDLFLTDGRIVSQRGRARGETMLYDAETVYRGDMAEGGLGLRDRRGCVAGSPPRAGDGGAQLRQGLGPVAAPARQGCRPEADHRAVLHPGGQIGAGRRDPPRHRRAANLRPRFRVAPEVPDPRERFARAPYQRTRPEGRGDGGRQDRRSALPAHRRAA